MIRLVRGLLRAMQALLVTGSRLADQSPKLAPEVRQVIETVGIGDLRDPEVFAQAQVAAHGRALQWPGDIDIGADTLWDYTLSAIGRDDTVAFRHWRMRHGLSLNAAAGALGLSRRMVAYYYSGEKNVPKTVLLACRGWEALHDAA